MLARFSRIAGVVLTALTFSILTASCINILDLEGYSDATIDLCQLIEECFGSTYFPECDDHAGPRLMTADARERSSWLVAFADSNCLENCTAARNCLDMPPVCGGGGSPCVREQQCCGFSNGFGTCDGGSCCSPDGIDCADAGDCCSGVCEGGFCGGFECTKEGGACSDGFQCCSGVCIDNECREETCFPEGSGCSFNGECCEPLYCDNGDEPIAEDGADDPEPVGRCTNPGCWPITSACEVDGDCCSQICFGPPGRNTRFCSYGQCYAEGTPCNPDEAFFCCSGTCHPDFEVCVDGCLGPGELCSSDGDCCDGVCDGNECPCRPATAPCVEHTDCCSLDCLPDQTCDYEATECKAPGEGCTAGDGACCSTHCGVNDECCDFVICNHTVCSTGGPLTNLCHNACPECPMGQLNMPCVDMVCQKRPECCCDRWRQSCVDEAIATCGAACPGVVDPMDPMGTP